MTVTTQLLLSLRHARERSSRVEEEEWSAVDFHREPQTVVPQPCEGYNERGCDYYPRDTAGPHHPMLLLTGDLHIIPCPEHHVSLIYTPLCVQ